MNAVASNRTSTEPGPSRAATQGAGSRQGNAGNSSGAPRMLASLSSAGIACRAGALVSWHPAYAGPRQWRMFFALDGRNRGPGRGIRTPMSSKSNRIKASHQSGGVCLSAMNRQGSGRGINSPYGQVYQSACFDPRKGSSPTHDTGPAEEERT